MKEYSDKDIAQGRLHSHNEKSSASARGKGFFSDQAHNSPVPSRSESLSRGKQEHLKGHQRDVPSHAAVKTPDHSTKAHNQRKAMNLKPKPVNKTRFKT